jgi:hypothetical protein
MEVVYISVIAMLRVLADTGGKIPVGAVRGKKVVGSFGMVVVKWE